MKLRHFLTSAAVAAALVAAGAAHAALATSSSFSGAGVGLSTSGWGSTTQVGTITADVPFGATVLAAYLYTSTYSWSNSVGGTLAANAVSYTRLGDNGGLEAGRADVTSIVRPIIDGGVGGIYNFKITEANGAQDGSALVVIYQDPTNAAIQSVGILDGFSLSTGDSTAINFATPLDKTAPGFRAEMRLGIGFSYDGSACSFTSQTSTVAVNGTTITDRAGCNDDSVDLSPDNGNLITVGGNNDPFSGLMPATQNDHERYNLTNYITNGDSSIALRTRNPSGDDNIFLAAFLVTGEAGFNEPPVDNDVPEPETLVLMGLALAGLGAQRRFAKRM